MASSIGTRLAAAAAVLVLLAGAGAPRSTAGESNTTEQTTAEQETTAEETTSEQAQSTVKVNVTGEGQVAVSPPGIVCPPDCSATFGEPVTVTLTARAGEGFGFAGWGGACASGERTCELVLDGSSAVEADFIEETTGELPPPPVSPPPPPPPTEPPTAFPPDPLEAVQRMFERLPQASIAFNTPPDDLAVGEAEVVQLLLAREPVRLLKRRLTAFGDTQGERIKVSGVMEAHLIGSKFRIRALFNEVQPVRREGVTEWKWEVEPTEAGVHRLQLTLYAFIKVNGSDQALKVRTFEETLVVRVTLLERLSAFVGDNWQWLWTAILIPVAGWLYGRRRKHAQPAV